MDIKNETESQLLVLGMLFVVPAVLFDILKARQLACVSKSGQKCPAAQSLSSRRAWIEIEAGDWLGRVPAVALLTESVD